MAPLRRPSPPARDGAAGPTTTVTLPGRPGLRFRSPDPANPQADRLVSALLLGRPVRSALLALTLYAPIACSSTPPRIPVDPSDDAGVHLDAATPDAANSDAGDLDGGGDPDGGGGPGEPELIRCPAGATLEFWSLAPITPLPAVSELEFTGLIGGTTVLNAGEGGVTVRFDLCRDGAGQRTLHGVLWATDEFSAPTYWVRDEGVGAITDDFVEYRRGMVYRLRTPPASLQVNGLEQALTGNLQPFELRILGDYGLLILGHGTFVAAAPGMVGPSAITYSSLSVVAGRLVPGDVLAGRPCPLGESLLERRWQMGSADFQIKACTYLGGGHTTAYRIHQLTITDGNAALTASEQGAHTFEGEAAVEAVLNYRWNHHNACDSFHLALPHADYAATTAPLAGCGAQVPNAPPRDFEDDPSGPVEFRVRYHGGAWTDGTMPGCTHYLFCN